MPNQCIYVRTTFHNFIENNYSSNWAILFSPVLNTKFSNYKKGFDIPED